MRRFLFFSILCTSLLIGCEKVAIQDTPDTFVDDCEGLKLDSSLVQFDPNYTRLVAGSDRNEFFDVTNSNIELCRLDQGLGREFFPALYLPNYSPISNFQYADDMRVIVIYDEGETKVYPYSLLSQHEIINELVIDEPVVVIFCELAEFAAVYTRRYCEQVFTFAPSGFTYNHPAYWDGLQGILMWDRETESLWWPLSDKGMSGLMQDVYMKKAPFQYWDDLTWGEVKKRYPNAVSLIPKQLPSHPSNLPKYNDDDLICK